MLRCLCSLNYFFMFGYVATIFNCYYGYCSIISAHFQIEISFLFSIIYSKLFGGFLFIYFLFLTDFRILFTDMRHKNKIRFLLVLSFRGQENINLQLQQAEYVWNRENKFGHLVKVLVQL